MNKINVLASGITLRLKGVLTHNDQLWAIYMEAMQQVYTETKQEAKAYGITNTNNPSFSERSSSDFGLQRLGIQCRCGGKHPRGA